MINRIEKWMQDVLKWKQRFELISSSNASQKWMMKEQLRRYDQIASSRLKHPTQEEKLSKSKLIYEKADLEKALYPNPILRLSRKVWKAVKKMGNILRNGKGDPNIINLQQPKIKKQLEHIGITNSFTNRSVHLLNNKSYSELLSPNEVLDSKLILSVDGKRLEGLELSLKKGNGEAKSIFIDASSSLDKQKAISLLQGKPVLVQDNWFIPDLNDRDESGHIRIKEISIPGYDIQDLLKHEDLAGLDIQKIQAITNALQLGKKVDILLDNHKIQIEADPMGQSLRFFRDGKKILASELKAPQSGTIKKMAFPAHAVKVKSKKSQKI